jgi:hypothetical protein
LALCQAGAGWWRREPVIYDSAFGADFVKLIVNIECSADLPATLAALALIGDVVQPTSV